ncbi:MAG TPA: hypothetical protein VFQ45_12845 [Longimicrobium sp.]|nr:hypothetical protein [Longimicrobium sp.]
MRNRADAIRFFPPLPGGCGIVLACLLLAGCGWAPGSDDDAERIERLHPPEEAVEEMGRTTSPDSLVDAVVTRTSVDATTPFVYRVHLLPRGGRPGADAGASFVADQAEALQVVWTGPTLLEIRYAKARIFDFSNFWRSREVKDFRHIVELQLRPAASPALPAPDWPPPL